MSLLRKLFDRHHLPPSEGWLPDPEGEPSPGGGVRLGSSGRGCGGFLFLLLFCIVWNGIIGIGFWSMFEDLLTTGTLDWSLLPLLFFLPFLLVGGVLVLITLWTGLGLINPRIEITLDRARVRPGDRLGVGWRFIGKARRVRSLTVELVGREEATYTRGTDTVTDTHDFLTLPIDHRPELHRELSKQGEALIKLPATMMHTFHAANNQIRWVLEVTGKVRWWPDVTDEFEVVVVPATQGFAAEPPRPTPPSPADDGEQRGLLP